MLHSIGIKNDGFFSVNKKESPAGGGASPRLRRGFFNCSCLSIHGLLYITTSVVLDRTPVV